VSIILLSPTIRGIPNPSRTLACGKHEDSLSVRAELRRTGLAECSNTRLVFWLVKKLQLLARLRVPGVARGIT